MADVAAHLATLPAINAALLYVTLALSIVFAWASVGALRLCCSRYPPCVGACMDRKRSALGSLGLASEVRRGRRAWGLAWTFAGFVAFGLYRIWWLWVNPAIPLPAIAVWIEVFRLVGGLFLMWAFWPSARERARDWR